MALRRVPFLAPMRAGTMPAKVSVVMTPRSDAGLAEAVAGLRRQIGLEVQRILVTDGGAVDGLEDPELIVVETGELPDGWLPRSHALSRALEQADGEWLLVLDELLVPISDDALQRLVEQARRANASCLAILPRTPAGLYAPLVLSSLIDSIPLMAATNRGRALMPWIGPTYLIRRDALERVGGMEPLRMAPMVELALAERLQEQGEATRVVQAQDEMRLAQPIDRAGLSESIERMLGAVGVRLPMMLVALLLYLGIWVAAIQAAFAPSQWGWWAFAGLMAQSVPAWMIAEAQRGPRLAALLAPFTLPVEAIWTGLTGLRLRMQRGVTWQGRFVSIDELRRAQRERED